LGVTSDQPTAATEISVPLVSRRIRRVLEQAGDIPAIEFEDRELTWSQVAEFARSLASLVKAADPGGRSAALVFRNRPATPSAMIALLAAPRSVLMVSGIQPTLSLCSDVRTVRPSIVIADATAWTPQLEETVRELGAAGIQIGEDEHGLAVSVRQGLARARSDKQPDSDMAILVPTSGTTGPPKRISITWKWLERFVRDVDAPVVGGRAFIHAIPLGTVGGVLTMLPWGTRPLTMALMERVDVSRWADLVERHKPEYAGLPPAGLHTLLEVRPPKEKFASLKAFVTGSAPLDPVVADGLEEAYGRPVFLSYGSTESGVVSNWPRDASPELRRAKRGSSGRVLPSVEVRILDPETWEPLPVGQVGIMEINNPDARFSGPDGWMRTNDLGRLDEDRFLYVEGRVDDVIIRGGLKVPLIEVERVLSEHPAVARCGATGLPDARLGQVPAALVVLKPDLEPQPGEADLVVWLRERLAPFKVPVRVLIVDDIPLTPMMKTNRKALREYFAAPAPTKT